MCDLFASSNGRALCVSRMSLRVFPVLFSTLLHGARTCMEQRCVSYSRHSGGRHVTAARRSGRVRGCDGRVRLVGHHSTVCTVGTCSARYMCMSSRELWIYAVRSNSSIPNSIPHHSDPPTIHPSIHPSREMAPFARLKSASPREWGVVGA